jgi:ubiquinone/menaquinone biosynthesis C-methylase UbiE
LTSNWREFWDRPHRIYVNDRHRRVHYAQVAADIIAEIPHASAIVLDYGCGEALQAADVTGRCKRLYLCESGPSLRDTLKRRFAGIPAIQVIAPEELPGLPDGSLDLVVANSVLQYLKREETRALAVLLRPKLAREGRLIFADVIPPDSSVASDVASLLSTAARHGFLLAALAGLVQTLVSDYRRLRHEIGLTTYKETEIAELLERAGYRAERRPENFGFNPRRMTIIARANG